MSDEEIIEKIKKGAEKTGETIEEGAKKAWKGAKHFGKDVKDSKPREAIEKEAKKGWGAIKDFGKKVKDKVTKDE
jgi:DNA-directed RNA polymerase subunit L